MRARRFVPLMAAAFLLLPALPASAHIEAFNIGGLVGAEPSNNNWVWHNALGQINCAEGEKFLVTAKVIDDDFVGKGRTKQTCTGDTQGWVVILDQRPGSGFGDGCWERASAKVHTKINGVPHDEERDTLPPGCV